MLLITIFVLLFQGHYGAVSAVGVARSAAAQTRKHDVGPLPDPRDTPGATNPDIKQSNIKENICKDGWSTKLLRPPARVTDKLKAEQMKEWGLSGAYSDYEEDHLISLELGGSPTDPLNLWPQKYNRPDHLGAHEKDKVENYLHRQVCAGKVSLKDAQHAIATDWVAVYKQFVQKKK